MSLNNMFTSNSAIKATLHILLLFTTKHGNLTDPISRLAPFSIAIMPAKAQKSALEMPCSSSPSFRYLSSRGSRASARPAFEDWFRLMQPLQPPTQLWNAKKEKIFFLFGLKCKITRNTVKLVYIQRPPMGHEKVVVWQKW